MRLNEVKSFSASTDAPNDLIPQDAFYVYGKNGQCKQTIKRTGYCINAWNIVE